MSAPLLYDKAPPNSVAFMLAWLLPISATFPLTFPIVFDPNTMGLGAKRWEAGMPLPYRMVRVIPGPSDLITAYFRAVIHTFASTYTQAAREADKTDRRMNVLAVDPLSDITMLDGSTANCQSMSTARGPREEPYGAESVVIRFVAEYDLALGFTPVAT